jgi:hypothetical protein
MRLNMQVIVLSRLSQVKYMNFGALYGHLQDK